MDFNQVEDLNLEVIFNIFYCMLDDVHNYSCCLQIISSMNIFIESYQTENKNSLDLILILN